MRATSLEGLRPFEFTTPLLQRHDESKKYSHVLFAFACPTDHSSFRCNKFALNFGEVLCILYLCSSSCLQIMKQSLYRHQNNLSSAPGPSYSSFCRFPYYPWPLLFTHFSSYIVFSILPSLQSSRILVFLYLSDRVYPAESLNILISTLSFVSITPVYVYTTIF
jgi:hypothetical protein